jgi:hypothetical protein
MKQWGCTAECQPAGGTCHALRLPCEGRAERRESLLLLAQPINNAHLPGCFLDEN